MGRTNIFDEKLYLEIIKYISQNECLSSTDLNKKFSNTTQNEKANFQNKLKKLQNYDIIYVKERNAKRKKGRIFVYAINYSGLTNCLFNRIISYIPAKQILEKELKISKESQKKIILFVKKTLLETKQPISTLNEFFSYVNDLIISNFLLSVE